ncbi:MAG TPA: hypothetical protein VNZ22_11310, partial [Bacillota bacterium]|nr:hypothetical protein [Bacillota bacterium]
MALDSSNCLRAAAFSFNWRAMAASFLTTHFTKLFLHAVWPVFNRRCSFGDRRKFLRFAGS